jgi:hypothetical protein
MTLPVLVDELLRVVFVLGVVFAGYRWWSRRTPR